MWRLGSSHCRKRRETRAAKAFRSFPSRRGAGAIGFENRDRLSIAMDWPFSNATSSLCAASKLFTKLTNYWRTVLAHRGSHYCPELHYMRGPEVVRGPRPAARYQKGDEPEEPCQDCAAIHFSKREFSAHYPVDPCHHPRPTMFSEYPAHETLAR
jgi:hypothetical protein